MAPSTPISPQCTLRIARSCELDATLEHELYTIEYRVISPEGDLRWVEARGRLTRDVDGQVIEIHGVCLDVTERNRADEAHRESEARFRSVTQSASDAIIAADSDGRITFWNNGARSLFGYARTRYWVNH